MGRASGSLLRQYRKYQQDESASMGWVLSNRPTLARGNRLVRTSAVVLLRCTDSDYLAHYLYDVYKERGWWLDIFTLDIIPCHTALTWHLMEDPASAAAVAAVVRNNAPLTKSQPRPDPFPKETPQ